MNIRRDLREKPSLHHSMADYDLHNFNISVTADARLHAAFHTRFEMRQTRNETNHKAKEECSTASATIEERIRELSVWILRLRATLKRLQNMKDLAFDIKSTLEKKNEEIHDERVKVIKVLGDREKRRGHDLTVDDVDRQLKGEIQFLTDFNSTLHDRIQDQWEKIKRMDQCEFDLTKDIERKEEASTIDTECFDMTEHHRNICHRLNPDDRSRVYDYTASIAITNDLYLKTHDLIAIVQKNNGDIEAAAQNAVNLFKSQLIAEIVKLSTELTAIEKSLIDNDNKIKMTESRMNLRQERPTIEQTFDNVSTVLASQLQSLQAAARVLKQRRDSLRHEIHMTQLQINLLNDDIESKQETYHHDSEAFKNNFYCGQ